MLSTRKYFTYMAQLRDDLDNVVERVFKCLWDPEKVDMTEVASAAAAQASHESGHKYQPISAVYTPEPTS